MGTWGQKSQRHGTEAIKARDAEAPSNTYKRDATPGIAQQSYSAKEEASFVDSWVAVPAIGPFIGRLGLPYTLLVGVFTYSIWQVYIFVG